MEITMILQDVENGVAGSVDRLAQAVLADLHRIAEGAMRRESEGHTLQPTELVDEAFVRLVGQQNASWQSRAHFFAVASRTIRHILVDHARHRTRQKRDHGVRVTLDESIADVPDRSLDLIALNEALEQLDAAAPRQARVVELRFFGGLEVDETAHALGVSSATVKRDWTFARAFLLRSLEKSA